MLSFNYELPGDEVIDYIKSGILDDDIKEYCKELLEGSEHITNHTIYNYFDITFLDSEYGYIVVGANIDDEIKYSKLSNTEKLLHNEFNLRVLILYNEAKEELKSNK